MQVGSGSAGVQRQCGQEGEPCGKGQELAASVRKALHACA